MRDSQRVMRSEPRSPLAVAVSYHPDRWSDATLVIAASIFDEFGAIEPARWTAILDRIELARTILSEAL